MTHSVVVQVLPAIFIEKTISNPFFSRQGWNVCPRTLQTPQDNGHLSVLHWYRHVLGSPVQNHHNSGARIRCRSDHSGHQNQQGGLVAAVVVCLPRHPQDHSALQGFHVPVRSLRFQLLHGPVQGPIIYNFNFL